MKDVEQSQEDQEGKWARDQKRDPYKDLTINRWQGVKSKINASRGKEGLGLFVFLLFFLGETFFYG